MNPVRILLLALTLAALSACQPKSAAPAAGDTSPPVATVNGEPISRDFYEFYIKGISGKSSADLTAEQRGEALDRLIRAELVADEADKQGFDKSGDTVYLMQLSRLNLLQQALSDHYLKDKKPTDEELRAEYQTFLDKVPKLEYHTRHILVATEPFAEKVISRLQAGEKFEDLAKVESMDTSKNQGGDLGWITPDRVVPDFARALVQLKPGEYTQKPVQTQYGWHIIKLEETRPLTPPTFEQLKPRLVQVVEAKKFKAYTDELMKNAQIVKLIDQAPATAPEAAPATTPGAAPAAAPASSPKS
jgi:peptidyl-prolyl cis-trans isomerase C